MAVVGHGAAWHALLGVAPMRVTQQTWPPVQLVEFAHVRPPPASALPPLLELLEVSPLSSPAPLLLLLLLLLPASPAGGVTGVLLELHATAVATEAERATKIHALFIFCGAS